MKLKNYQETVLQDLSTFIDAVDCENDIIKGWKKLKSQVQSRYQKTAASMAAIPCKS